MLCRPTIKKRNNCAARSRVERVEPSSHHSKSSFSPKRNSTLLPSSLRFDFIQSRLEQFRFVIAASWCSLDIISMIEWSARAVNLFTCFMAVTLARFALLRLNSQLVGNKVSLPSQCCWKDKSARRNVTNDCFCLNSEVSWKFAFSGFMLCSLSQMSRKIGFVWSDQSWLKTLEIYFN